MQILRLPSIRAKLLALFAVAGLLPIALVSLLAYFNSLKAVEEMVGNRTERLSEEVAEQLSEKLERRVNDRILVVNRPVQDFLGAVDAGNAAGQMKAYSVLEGYLGDLFKEYADYYDGLILADSTGGLVFHYSRSEGAAGVLTSPAAYWEPAPAAPRHRRLWSLPARSCGPNPRGNMRSRSDRPAPANASRSVSRLSASSSSPSGTRRRCHGSTPRRTASSRPSTRASSPMSFPES